MECNSPANETLIEKPLTERSSHMANRKNPFLGKRTVGHHALAAAELKHVDALRRLGTPEEVISDVLDRINCDAFNEINAALEVMGESNDTRSKKLAKERKRKTTGTIARKKRK